MSSPASQPKKTIRQLRRERGWTQAELAQRLGTTDAVVSSWERGEYLPRPATRWRLADLFGVEVSEITFGEGEQP